MGSYDREIADLNKPIELDPESAHPYNHLAWVFATAPEFIFRNGKHAVQLAEKALALDRDAQNLDTLAAALAEMGRFEEAIATQLDAINRLKRKVDRRSMTEFEKHLERYRSNKPWRTSLPGSTSDYTATATKLINLAERYRARGKYAEAEPLYKRVLAIREKALGPGHEDVANSLDRLAEFYRAQSKNAEAEPLHQRAQAIRENLVAVRETARRRREARKREIQTTIESLSGRYTTAGGRSQWDISFRNNRFEARYLRDGKRTLLYDGTVTGTRITGRAHLGLGSFCRQSPTPPLYGSVDLLQKSFEIFWADYDLVQMSKNKNCVPTTVRRIWTQGDRI